jgi:oxygen-independent coproporphyrinogen-3 oxidase
MSFGLYLHYPFVNYVSQLTDNYREIHTYELERRFFKALQIETRLRAMHSTHTGKIVSTIYIGGGTLSAADNNLLLQWLKSTSLYFTAAEDLEFSVECSPEKTTLEQLTFFRNIGVNRPVLCVGTFQTKLRDLLGCRHTVEDIQRTVYFYNALGFRNFGIDLWFGIPGQTSRMVSDDVDQALDLEPHHISLYQMPEVSEGDSPQSKAQLDSDLIYAMYRGSSERLIDAGYERYEVSSFAKPGFACRHNQAYWDGSDYLGLGPSAHSFVNGQRFANVAEVGTYIDRLADGEIPSHPDLGSIEMRMSEAILMGLRTSQGVNRSRFIDRFGVPVESRLNQDQYQLLIETGHLVTEAESLRLSAEGILAADEIARRLVR